MRATGNREALVVIQNIVYQHIRLDKNTHFNTGFLGRIDFYGFLCKTLKNLFITGYRLSISINNIALNENRNPKRNQGA